jgi:hypothetical protein
MTKRVIFELRERQPQHGSLLARRISLLTARLFLPVFLQAHGVAMRAAHAILKSLDFHDQENRLDSRKSPEFEACHIGIPLNSGES